MPSPKQFDTNAQRQAAYRARHVANKPPTEAELALLARSLHVVLEEALSAGSTELPDAVLGRHAGDTLRRLIHYLDPHPDPVRYQGKARPTS